VLSRVNLEAEAGSPALWAKKAVAYLQIAQEVEAWEKGQLADVSGIRLPLSSLGAASRFLR
jgi:hypothetical protein